MIGFFYFFYSAKKKSAEIQDKTNIEGKFNWSKYDQGLLLGCFYLGYFLTELPGGRLAELIGGYRVFGHSMLWASLLTLITPLAAFIDFKVIALSRIMLGFMLGK